MQFKSEKFQRHVPRDSLIGVTGGVLGKESKRESKKERDIEKVKMTELGAITK